MLPCPLRPDACGTSMFEEDTDACKEKEHQACKNSVRDLCLPRCGSGLKWRPCSKTNAQTAIDNAEENNCASEPEVSSCDGSPARFLRRYPLLILDQSPLEDDVMDPPKPRLYAANGEYD